MRPGVADRRATARAHGVAVAETLRRRARTVVGKTTATFTAAPTTDSPRVVLERDIGAFAWQLLAVAQTATAGAILYFDGAEWVALEAGEDGQVLTMASGAPKWLSP